MTTQTATPALPAAIRARIADCLACASACTETVSYCLEQGGGHADPDHIRLLLDGAELARAAADLMLRGSPYHAEICALAARLAADCARSCAMFPDDARMKACAYACLRCASSCKDARPATGVHGERGYDQTVADSYPASDPPSTSGARA